MTPTHRVAILLPSTAGACAIACALFMYALALSATAGFVRHEKQLGHAGANFWVDVAIVSLTISFALAAHLVDVAVWGDVLHHLRGIVGIRSRILSLGGQLHDPGYGYGDLIMTPAWRLLGPQEAADGMLMFGVSTAIIFAVIQHLIQVRFVDLRDNRLSRNNSEEVAESPSLAHSYLTAKKVWSH
jgi:hypothetical protein